MHSILGGRMRLKKEKNLTFNGTLLIFEYMNGATFVIQGPFLGPIVLVTLHREKTMGFLFLSIIKFY